MFKLENKLKSHKLLLIAFSVVGTFCLLISIYGLLGVLQAGSLFVGERALLNANVWGSVFLVGLVLAVLCFLFAYASRPGPKVQCPWWFNFLLGFVFLMLGATLCWPIFRDFFAIDRCQDLGGSFDYVMSQCDQLIAHKYIPLLERQGFFVVSSLLFVVFGVYEVSLARRQRTRFSPNHLELPK